MRRSLESWDYLVVTASNCGQALAYETQLELREELGLLAKGYMERGELVPDEVTGGLDTVAVRMPQNKIALALIKRWAIRLPRRAPTSPADPAAPPPGTCCRTSPGQSKWSLTEGQWW
jgi:hypothetical protein